VAGAARVAADRAVAFIAVCWITISFTTPAWMTIPEIVALST